MVQIFYCGLFLYHSFLFTRRLPVVFKHSIFNHSIFSNSNEKQKNSASKFTTRIFTIDISIRIRRGKIAEKNSGWKIKIKISRFASISLFLFSQHLCAIANRLTLVCCVAYTQNGKMLNVILLSPNQSQLLRSFQTHFIILSVNDGIHTSLLTIFIIKIFIVSIMKHLHDAIRIHRRLRPQHFILRLQLLDFLFCRSYSIILEQRESDFCRLCNFWS